MSGNNAKWFTRIIALFMALLLLGGALAAAIQAIAMGSLEASVAIANTGESNTNAWVIIVAVVALAILTCVTVVPKILKKK